MIEKYFSSNQKQLESGLFVYLVRCLFTNFGWLDSMVGGWVIAKVCGSFTAELCCDFFGDWWWQQGIVFLFCFFN